MTHLRQLMLDELERRNYSPNTVRSYLHAVEEFARHFGRSPEQLGPDHVREYQVHLFRDRKLSARTIAGQTAALRPVRQDTAAALPARCAPVSQAFQASADGAQPGRGRTAD